MSEEHFTAPAAPSPAPSAVPEFAAPAAPAPAPAPTPSVTPAPAAPTAAPQIEAPGPNLHTGVRGILSTETPEPVPEQAPVPQQSAEQATPEYAFHAPGLDLSSQPYENFTQLARSHSISPEVAQNLLNEHVSAMNSFRDATLQAQHDAFAEMRAAWRNEVMSDPGLGGSGFATNKAAAMRMLQAFMPEAHRAGFEQALLQTGMSDNPHMFRFLLNIARRFDEPRPSAPPARAQPAQTPPSPPPTLRDPIQPAAAPVGNSRLPYLFARGSG